MTKHAIYVRININDETREGIRDQTEEDLGYQGQEFQLFPEEMGNQAVSSKECVGVPPLNSQQPPAPRKKIHLCPNLRESRKVTLFG